MTTATATYERQDGTAHLHINVGFEGCCAHTMRQADGTLPAYAWPGGYPIYYLTEEEETVCAACANTETSDPAEYGAVNWESTDMVCADCGEFIESAYGDA